MVALFLTLDKEHPRQRGHLEGSRYAVDYGSEQVIKEIVSESTPFLSSVSQTYFKPC